MLFIHPVTLSNKNIETLQEKFLRHSQIMNIFPFKVRIWGFIDNPTSHIIYVWNINFRKEKIWKYSVSGIPKLGWKIGKSWWYTVLFLHLVSGHYVKTTKTVSPQCHQLVNAMLEILLLFALPYLHEIIFLFFFFSAKHFFFRIYMVYQQKWFTSIKLL